MTLNGANVRWWNDQSKYGNNIGIAATSAQPLWNTTTNSIDFDGIAEQLDVPQAIWGSDLEGTWYLRFKDLEGTGVLNVQLDFGIGSGTDRFSMQMLTSDKYRLNVRYTGIQAHGDFPNAITRSAFTSIIAKSLTASYFASENGSSLGTPAPNNNGKWFGDMNELTGKKVMCGNATGSLYYSNAFKACVYVNRVTSTDEDVLMLDWMDTL